MLRLRSLALVALLVLAAPAVSAQEGPPPSSAEELFQAARALLKSGDLAAACPKFAESYRLEPATGTLLGVAACHEQQGLLASAWREFTQAAASAREEGRSDRETIALERAEALRPRLSTLIVWVPGAVLQREGFQIWHNAVPLDESQLNRLLPVDGGLHIIEAQAPGFVPFERRLSMAEAGEHKTFWLPELQPLPPPPAQREQATNPESPASAPAQPGLAPSQMLGLGLGALALGAAVVSAVHFKVALDKMHASKPWCDGRECLPQGLDLREDAVAWGNRATLFGLGSGALLTAGIALYYFGKPDPEQSPGALSLAIDPRLRAGSAHLRIGF
ncbi:MAG: hypothetical protein ABW217_02500 [Polyangiaceae bacterium]